MKHDGMERNQGQAGRLRRVVVAAGAVAVIVVGMVWWLTQTSQESTQVAASISLTTLAPTTTTVALTSLPDDLHEGRQWEFTSLTRPAIDDSPAIERSYYGFVRFEYDAQLDQHLMKVRTGCIGKDILIEWTAPHTFRPIEVLMPQFELPVLTCGSPRPDNFFLPGEGHRVTFFPPKVAGEERPRFIEVILGETVDVSYDERTETLTLHRGGLNLSASPGELPKIWVVTEEFVRDHAERH